MKRWVVVVPAAAGVASSVLWASVAIAAGSTVVRWSAVVALWCTLLAIGVVTCLVLVDRRRHRSAERLERLMHHLDDAVAENHRRASVWNYHLTNGLGLGPPPSREMRDPGAEHDGDRPEAPVAQATGASDHFEPPARPVRDDILSVVVVPDSEWDARACLDAVGEQAADLGAVEVVVVDGAAVDRRDEYWRADVELVYRHLPGVGREHALHLGSLLAGGARLLVLDQVDALRDRSLRGMLAALDDPGVVGAQAVVVDGQDVIRSAGYAFHGTYPVPSALLRGQPMDDARALRGERLRAVDGRALLLRTEAFRRAGGLDVTCGSLADADLCLRAGAEGSFRVVPDAIATCPDDGRAAGGERVFAERWRGRTADDAVRLLAPTGLLLGRVGSDGGRLPRPEPVLDRARGASPVRWGIKIASPGGPAGDRWGDTYFAESLRAALGGAGLEAVVHRHGSHVSTGAAMDDVSLVLRGRYRVNLMPGQVNVLWVISHPENVTPQEVRDYDLVFAASGAWAREMTRRSGRLVRPLLQATDPERFSPDGSRATVDAPLFVGGTHDGRERRVVAAAERAGVPVAIYGQGWDGLAAAGAVRGTSIPNAELARYYRGAPVVLADHWPEMAAQGFVQNRLFDAVAAGSRVVSDPVDGIDELFGGAVRVYRTDAELRDLCSGQAEMRFPSEDERVDIATRVRRDHSFGRRAEQLRDAVQEHLAPNILAADRRDEEGVACS